MQKFNEGSQDLASDHNSGADIYTMQWRETATLRLRQQVQLRGGIDHVFTHWTADFVTELPNLVRRYPTPLEDDLRTSNVWHMTGTGLEQAYWSEVILGPSAGVTVTPGLRASNLVFGTGPAVRAGAAAGQPLAGGRADGVHGRRRHLPQAARAVLGADGRWLRPAEPAGRAGAAPGVGAGAGAGAAGDQARGLLRAPGQAALAHRRGGGARRQGRAGAVPQRRARPVVRRGADGAAAGRASSGGSRAGWPTPCRARCAAIAEPGGGHRFVRAAGSRHAPAGDADREQPGVPVAVRPDPHPDHGRPAGAALEHVAGLPLPAGLGQPDHAARAGREPTTTPTATSTRCGPGR